MNYVKRIITTFVLLFVAVGVTVQARGSLFDDEYTSCHWSMRFRGEQFVSNLVVTRDSQEADQINVSWDSTDPENWGLGSNNWDTTFTLIVTDGTKVLNDDGDLVDDVIHSSYSLKTNSASFEGIDPGTDVQVELAIVVSEPDGDYVISDVLEASIAQSLLAPSFSTSVMGGSGEFYYVGYNGFGPNENLGFTNYFYPSEHAQRFTIGVRHANPSYGMDHADLDRYMIRVEDSDGDVVPEINDVPMYESKDFYRNNNLYVGLVEKDHYSNVRFVADNPKNSYEINTGSNPYFSDTGMISPRNTVLPVYSGIISSDTFGINTNDVDSWEEDVKNWLQNWEVSVTTTGSNTDTTVFTQGTVGSIGDNEYVYASNIFSFKTDSENDNTVTVKFLSLGASPPDYHANFRPGVLEDSERYTIQVWGVNEDDEVITPTATLTLYPQHLPSGENMTVTEFTVIE